MYIFVECWRSRPEWMALTVEARAAYMAELGKGIAELLKSGAEIITWSINEPDTDQRSPYDYLAVWKFPTREHAMEFEKIVRQSGWYNYFDQVNLRGSISTPNHSIEHMVGL
jgi:hypothetical protein